MRKRKEHISNMYTEIRSYTTKFLHTCFTLEATREEKHIFERTNGEKWRGRGLLFAFTCYVT